MKMTHGGDLAAVKTQYTGELLDFSVNLNPLGPCPAALAAAREAISWSGQYPDPHCRELRAAIARREGVTPEQVFCGSGASDVIFRLAVGLRPKVALVTAPAFSEYEGALESVGCQVIRHRLLPQNQFDVTEDILQALAPEVELAFLCTPNNPTGRVISLGLLEGILFRCRENGTVLALDECFLELSTGGGGAVPLLERFENLILLRAFTKSYAIPGLRLGYGLSANRELLEALEDCGPCWQVSGPAQAAGIACCQAPQWSQWGRELVEEQRPLLAAGLAQLGCQVVESQANYLLFRCPGEERLQEKLLHRGILIRACGNYQGLGRDWYRVAVRQEAENARLLAAIGAEREGN